LRFPSSGIIWILLALAMKGYLLIPRAIFFYFKTTGCILFIFLGTVVASFALSTR